MFYVAKTALEVVTVDFSIDSICVAVGLIHVSRTFPCLKLGSHLLLGDILL